MLSSEFAIELSNMIRRMQSRILNEPDLLSGPDGTGPDAVQAHIERAIVALARWWVEVEAGRND